MFLLVGTNSVLKKYQATRTLAKTESFKRRSFFTKFLNFRKIQIDFMYYSKVLIS